MNPKSRRTLRLEKADANVRVLRISLKEGWDNMDAAQLIDKHRDYGVKNLTIGDCQRIAALAVDALTFKPVSTLWDMIPNHPYGATPKALSDAPDRRPLCCVIAKRALVAAYDEEFDPEATIGDLLADLRHLCDRLGLDFAEMDRAGLSHYRDEIRKS